MIHTLHAVLRAIAATAEPLPKPSDSLSPEIHKSTTCLQPQACVFQFFLDLLGGGIRRFPCSQPACAQGPRLLPTSCVLVLRTRIEGHSLPRLDELRVRSLCQGSRLLSPVLTGTATQVTKAPS